MKTCTQCETEKPLSEFYFLKSRNSYMSRCKVCDLEDSKKRRLENGASWNNTTKERIDRNRSFVIKYLESHPCVDCGFTDIRALQFDHVRGTKSANLAYMINNTRSIKSIENEIQKCEVRCANCHSIVTSDRAGNAKSVHLGNISRVV